MKASRTATILLAAAILLGTLSTTTAQDANAPHLSATTNVLFAHHHDSDTTELEGWMNTLLADPTSNDIALGPSGAWSQTRTFKLTLKPGLTQDVTLDKTKPAIITAHLGGGSANGIARVTSTLDVGTTRILDGAVQNHIYREAGTGQYPKLSWSVNPAVDVIPAGQPLVWTITATGAGQALFLGLTPERGASNITLPVLTPASAGPAPSAPSINYHEEAGVRVEASISSEEATNASHQYNWTTDLEDVEFAWNAAITNGSVDYVIKDGDNATVAEGSLSGSDNGTELISDAVPGNWTVRINVTDFSGAFTFSLAEATDEVPPPSGSPTTSSRPPTSSSGAANQTRVSDESTPAPGLLAALCVLALGTLWTSRRRRLP